MSRKVSARARVRARAGLSVTLAAGLLLTLASATMPDLLAAQAEADAAEFESSTTPTTTVEPLHTATPTTVREALPAGRLVQQYLDERYGPGGAGAAWHANVRRVAMRLGTVVVQTDLADGPETGRQAAAICEAVLGVRATSPGRQLSGLTVEVYGQGGRLLAQDREMLPTPTPLAMPDW